VWTNSQRDLSFVSKDRVSCCAGYLYHEQPAGLAVRGQPGIGAQLVTLMHSRMHSVTSIGTQVGSSVDHDQRARTSIDCAIVKRNLKIQIS